MASGNTGVRFRLEVRLASGREEEFLARYAALAARIEQGLSGHIAHELWQHMEEPDRWAIVSRWQSLEAAQAWERSPEHKELTTPLRACWVGAERSAYALRVESRRRTEEE